MEPLYKTAEKSTNHKGMRDIKKDNINIQYLTNPKGRGKTFCSDRILYNFCIGINTMNFI